VEGKCEEEVSAASDETFFASITKKNFSEKHLCVRVRQPHVTAEGSSL